MKIRSAWYVLIPSVLFFTSCQRESGFSDTSKVTADSTLLVKSITFINYDSSGVAGDSITENYSYDTVNRKITILWDGEFGHSLDGVSGVFSYNTGDLLTNVQYTYPAGYVFTGEDYSAVSISYDNQDILSSVVITYVQGGSRTINYTKTTAGSGYVLNWGETFDPQDWYKRRVKFNAAGNCISNMVEFPLLDGNGDVYTTVFYTDSLTYDAAGNLQKVFSQYADTSQQTVEDFLALEFESRLAKGDQLSDQRRALLSGLHNMPFGDNDDWFELSILAYSVDAFQHQQFSKFPIQSAKVRRAIDNNMGHFTANSVFDNNDRLVKFTGFFNDIGIQPQVYRVSYYK